MITVGRTVVIAAIAALSLSGCAETRRALGYDKAPPDEFAVVSRAPLSQPPDFALRPPDPGAARPQEGTTSDQAKAVLFGSQATAKTAAFTDRSAGERFLLTKAGADKAQPDIRRKVNEDASALAEANQSFTDEILFWQKKAPPGDVVDAAKEAKRIEDDTALGKPVTEGDTPKITHRQKGWLEGIF
jgi:hypothetical protein